MKEWTPIVLLLFVLATVVVGHSRTINKLKPPPEHYCQEKPTYCTPLTNGAGE